MKRARRQRRDHDNRSRPECDNTQAAAWFAGHIPDSWFTGPITVRHDREEMQVHGTLAVPTSAPEGDDAQKVAAQARIAGFREDTRAQRMQIAEAAQAKWGRTVSWTVSCGEVDAEYTTAAVPVMTRLRFDQRQVLDTLIETGVVRSRSEGLAWCVAQVATHQEEWFSRLKAAMTEVERIRNEGPDGQGPSPFAPGPDEDQTNDE